MNLLQLRQAAHDLIEDPAKRPMQALTKLFVLLIILMIMHVPIGHQMKSP